MFDFEVDWCAGARPSLASSKTQIMPEDLASETLIYPFLAQPGGCHRRHFLQPAGIGPLLLKSVDGRC